MSATDGGLGPTPTWNEDTPTMTTLVVSSATSWLDYLQQVANAVQDQPVSAYDPVSSLQPKFATSAMCQILVFGIVFALGWVLFGLLIFSSRYHWPLSKINFCMQLAAVLAFLLQVSVSIIIVMLFSRERAQTWPYMFDYIELALPRDTWGDGEKAAWLFMQGFTALAIHAVHLQFLTLLFPSKIEKTLILTMLGPLAILSCFLQFLDIHRDIRARDLGDSFRAVCNSTLALLYTTALLVWGFAFNRDRAWRNDGGTSAFGICAILLGFTGSAVNYVEIKESTILWLQLLIWTILIWQSWISFWWWVSTGMYAGEVADRDRREKRRARKAEKRRARARRAAGGALATVALDGSVIESTGSRVARRLGLGSLRHRHAPPTVADDTDRLHRQDSANSAARLTDNGQNEPTLSRRRRPTFSGQSRQTQQQQGEDHEMERMDQHNRGTRSNASSSDPSDTTAPNAVMKFLTSGWSGRLLAALSLAHHQATRNRAAMELPFARTAADGTGPFQVFNAVDEIAQQARDQDQPNNSNSNTRTTAVSRRPPSPSSSPSHRADSPSGASGSLETPSPDATPARQEEERPPARTPHAEQGSMPESSWMWKGRIRQARLRDVDRF